MSSRNKSGRSGGPAGDCPLDLSVSHKGKGKESEGGGGGGMEGPLKKLAKWSPSSLEPMVGGRDRDRKNSWNGNSSAHSPDIKALEKMSEMSRGGGGQSEGKLASSAGGRGTYPFSFF